MELINMPGLKISLLDNGQLEIALQPEEAPYEPPGFVEYEVKREGFDLIQNLGIFRVDSKLKLNEWIHREVDINGGKFVISLIGDKENHLLNEVQVSYISNNRNVYEKLNKLLFKAAVQTINNLALFHQQPIKLGTFIIIHNDLSVYTFLHQKESIEYIRGIPFGGFINDEFFQHSSDNYRKYLNSTDPITKYLSLYISIESIRALIRKKLGLFPSETGNIIHPNYTEPILIEDFSLNGAKQRIKVRKNETFYNLLYKRKEEKGSLRNLRNTAAHTITNEGHLRLTDSLDDYLDYQSAIPYIHHMYLKYLNIAIDLYN